MIWHGYVNTFDSCLTQLSPWVILVYERDLLLHDTFHVPFCFAKINHVITMNDMMLKGKLRWSTQNSPPLPWQLLVIQKHFAIGWDVLTLF